MKAQIVISALLAMLVVTPAMAVKVIPKTIRSKSYLTKAKDGIYASLDLKEKNLRFEKVDNQTCLNKLARQPESLKYSCEIEIPTKARMSILEKVKTGESLPVIHGGMAKQVKVKVSKDGRKVTFSTEFDTAGIDFSFADMNDEIFRIFDQAALQIFEQAMKSPMQIEILEN